MAGLVGVEGSRGPLVGFQQIPGDQTQDREKLVGTFGVDHVGGQRLGELGQRGVHGVHGFKRRELQVEALTAGAKLGQPELAGTIAQVIDAVFLASDGSRVTGSAVVVSVSASSVVAHESPSKLSVASCQKKRSQMATGRA